MSSKSCRMVPGVSASPSHGESSCRARPVKRTRSPFRRRCRSRISTVRNPKVSLCSSSTLPAASRVRPASDTHSDDRCSTAWEPGTVSDTTTSAGPAPSCNRLGGACGLLIVRVVGRDAHRCRGAMLPFVLQEDAVADHRAAGIQFAADALAANPRRSALGQPHVSHDAAERPPVVPSIGRAARAESRDGGGARPIVDLHGQHIARRVIALEISKEYAVNPPSWAPSSTPFSQTRAA